MRLRFWGVRGSIPVPGAETSRYGGNTSCVEIFEDGCPTLVFDCGTGARPLGRELVGRPERAVHVVFTHFHMDHLFGFPFFAPLYTPAFAVSVTAPMFTGDATRERVSRYLNGVFHPLRLADIPAELEFLAVRPREPFQRGPYAIRSETLNHPGGSYGYRVEKGGKVVCYVTDTAPLTRPGEGLAGGGKPTARERQLVELLRGADAVVFDTMFTHEAYLERMTWGHAYPEYAVALCVAADVRTLYLFHHAPEATDDELDALAERWASATHPTVKVAREGEIVDLEG